MRPLIITDNARVRAKRLIEYAEKHPLSMDDLLDTVNKELQPIGDDPNHCMNLQKGFRVVYSIKMQPAGKVRHLSVSVDKPGKVPSVAAMEMIMELLEFENPLENCKLSFEKIGPNHEAINVLEVLKLR